MITNAAEALATGQKFYTSTRCKLGHAPIRYAKSRACVECNKMRTMPTGYVPKKAQEAKAAGNKFYIAKPCKRGHAPLRYSSTGACVACQKKHSKGWSKSHPKQFYSIQLKYIQKKLLSDPNSKLYKGFRNLAEKKIQSSNGWVSSNPVVKFDLVRTFMVNKNDPRYKELKSKIDDIKAQIKEAEAFADEHGLAFDFNVNSVVEGFYYGEKYSEGDDSPHPGWHASSQNC